MRSWSLILVLGLGQTIAFGSSFYLLGVLGDPMARSLGLSEGFVFSLMSLALLVSALAGPWTGRWLDASGGRAVLLASNGVFAAGLVVLAFAPGGAVLAAGMAVLGVGMAIGLYGTPFKILVGEHGEAARPAITAVALLGGMGGAAGWPANLALEAAFGWRGACLAWAGLHLLCVPVYLWIVPRPGPPPPHAAAGPEPAIVWDRRMVQLAVLFAGAWCLSTAMSAHLPRLLQALGLDRERAVGTAALAGAAAVCIRFLEMTVFRRVSPLLTARAATLMHPLGAGLLLALGPRLATGFTLAQGAGQGLLSVAGGTLPLALFGPRGYGQRSALLQTPARFLQIAGPTVFALLLARSPMLALGVTSAVCGVMFLATLGLRPQQTA